MSSGVDFPHTVILKASAGSGKTHALTKRYVCFLLSKETPCNSLRNVLAVTFSNNAAKEMKERILEWLKSLALGDTQKLAEISSDISVPTEELTQRASSYIDLILANYSDFQVKTIDSFMTSVFKASSVDLGVAPDFDIILEGEPLMRYAFELYLRRVREGTYEGALMEGVLNIVRENRSGQASYLWEPTGALLTEIRKLYTRIAHSPKAVLIDDMFAPLATLKKYIVSAVHALEALIESSGLARSANSSYESIRLITQGKNFTDLIGKGLKNAPVKKPSSKKGNPQYDEIRQAWEALTVAIRNYTAIYSRTFYVPFLRVYSDFRETLERVKRNQGKVFIDDINKKLSEYLRDDVVPDVYFRLGETICHYMIDEFQDTSPVQWSNLKPLIENSVSMLGSLFCVGDTKQAIYGFRGADYTIMKHYESTPFFPSATHSTPELKVNYRSDPAILLFNEIVFKENLTIDEELWEAGKRSGLTDYTQYPREDNTASGHVQVVIVPTTVDANSEASDDKIEAPEKVALTDTIMKLKERGYANGDIAVLTFKNDDVVQVADWLNEAGLPFISFSSLDIRRRKITGEIVSLLDFLDSPIDDLSFTAFIMGSIFAYKVRDNGLDGDTIGEFLLSSRTTTPRYKAFQERFPALWESCFAGIFKSAGYLPLYDLVTEIYRVFDCFNTVSGEEATLVKILEVIKNYEDTGNNNIRDFLDFAINESRNTAEWNVDIPKTADAITLMTVHKAKGLGFPVVITLLYENRRKGLDYAILEDETTISVLKLNKKIANSSIDELKELYDEEMTKLNVSRLNTLYVAFTRAKEELYVIGACDSVKGFPFMLLPLEGYEPIPLPAIERKQEASRPTTLTFHQSYDLPLATITSQALLNVGERMRGELIHKALSFITYIDDDGSVNAHTIASTIAGTIDNTIEHALLVSPELISAKELRTILEKCLTSAHTREYFRTKPGRSVYTEMEYATSAGVLYRMDRVIVDDNSVTILDFKSGRESVTAYKGQIVTYMKLLSEVYLNKPIEGVIINVDTGEIARLKGDA